MPRISALCALQLVFVRVSVNIVVRRGKSPRLDNRSGIPKRCCESAKSFVRNHLQSQCKLLCKKVRAARGVM